MTDTVYKKLQKMLGNIPLSQQSALQSNARKRLALDIRESPHLGYDPHTYRNIPVLQNKLSKIREDEIREATENYRKSFGTDGGKKSRKRKSKKRKSKKRKSKKRKSRRGKH